MYFLNVKPYIGTFEKLCYDIYRQLYIIELYYIV